MLKPAHDGALCEWVASIRMSRTGDCDNDPAPLGPVDAGGRTMAITDRVVAPSGRDEDGDVVPLEPADPQAPRRPDVAPTPWP